MSNEQSPLPPDENRALPALSIYMWIGCAIATTIIITRLITRIKLKQAAGLDDLFIGISFVFAVLLYAGTAILLHRGYGRHIIYIPQNDLIVMLKVNTMVNIAGFTSLAFARTSIGLFLLRLTSRVMTSVWVLYFGLVLNAVQAIALIVLTGVHCVPIEKMWDPSVSGFCIDAKKFTAADRFLGCLNVIVDLIFALFPLVIIRNIQIERKWLLATYLLISCGLLTAVCSVGRVVASDLDAVDITWDLVPLTYWALSETSGCLILASLPAMRQLFRQTETAKKFTSYLNSRSPRTQNSKKSTKNSRSSETASARNLVVTEGNIHMKKDYYVELSDRVPGPHVSHQRRSSGEISASQMTPARAV